MQEQIGNVQSQGMRSTWIGPLLAVMAFLLGGLGFVSNAAADEAALVRIEYGGDLVVDAHVDRVRRDLQRRLIEVADSPRMTELWESAIVFSPNPEVDHYFIENSGGLTDGRNLFFEGEYETAIDALGRWLDRFERAPEVLAAHPDLVPVTFECLLMIVRSYDAVGDPEAAEAAMERIIHLFRYADASPFAFDEAFISRVSEARRVYSTHSVTIRWESATDCTVLINGSDASATSGAELLLPETPQFLQLSCNEGDSLIYRLSESDSEVHLDLDFDDTLRNSDGLPELWPRSSAAPNLLRRLAHQAARTLGVEMVFTVGLSPEISGSPAALEISRWSSVESSFRAIRLPLDLGTDDADVSDAIHYLISGDVTGDFIVWQEVPGWVRVNEEGVVVEEPSSAPEGEEPEATTPDEGEIRIVIESPSQPQFAPEVRRPFSWFFLFPLALSGGSYYLSTVFEGHRADSRRMLEECSRADVTCTPIVYNDRETTMNNNRLYRDVALGTAGVMAVTGVSLLVGMNLRRGPKPQPTAWIDPATGSFGAAVQVAF